MKRYLGIDIGGNSIKYGIYDEYGNEIEISQGNIRTPKYNIIKISNILISIISQFENLDGIGISIPGSINPQSGFIQSGGSVKALNGVNIIDILKEFTDVKIEIENDANCALLAEKWIGNATECENFICITLGSGIGGAMYINGKLVNGKNYYAGEFGYMLIEDVHERYKINTLNKNGATIPFIKQVAKEKKLDYRQLTGIEVFEMIEQGDPIVIDIYKRWIRRIAVCIYNLGFIIDPEKILIGGGVSSQPKFINDIKWELECISIELIPELGKKESLKSRWEIENCKYFNDAGKIGAVYNFMIKNKLLNSESNSV